MDTSLYPSIATAWISKRDQTVIVVTDISTIVNHKYPMVRFKRMDTGRHDYEPIGSFLWLYQPLEQPLN